MVFPIHFSGFPNGFPIHHHRHHEVSYGAAVNACERAMQWWPALQSLQRLQGIWPSTWDRTIQQLVPRMASQGQRGIPRGYTRTKFTCIYIYILYVNMMLLMPSLLGEMVEVGFQTIFGQTQVHPAGFAIGLKD